MWDDLIRLLDTHERFLVTTHIHPDGDAIGTLVGMGCLLEELGKAALLVCHDPVPPIYQFLDPDGQIRHYEPECDDADIAACDAAIVLDVGALDRIGRVADALAKHAMPIACIDHHVTNDGFADVNVVVPDAASTASLVLDLTRAMGRTPSARVAEALYVGLATDTGWFRFHNATPQAFRDAADLVAFGASPIRVYESVYENRSAARMRLLGLALADLKTECDGRIAWVAVTNQMFADTGATEAELEGFVDNLRKVGGTEILILFRDRPEGGSRVSLRAKHDADVGSLAERFGGGGHRAAAGITLDTHLSSTIPTILAAARQLLDN